MPTQLLNKSVEQVLSLPYPYAGCVAPGESAILREDPATVVALLGVSKFARMPISLVTLRASEVRVAVAIASPPTVQIYACPMGSTMSLARRKSTSRIFLMGLGLAFGFRFCCLIFVFAALPPPN